MGDTCLRCVLVSREHAAQASTGSNPHVTLSDVVR